MGALSPLQGIGPDDLKIRSLLARVASGRVEEIVLATNPTVEGEATAIYLAKLLSPSASASRASPWASPSAATSNTPTK